MKKHITLLSGLLVVSGAFAQVKNQLPVQSKAKSAISVFNGKVTTQNQGTEKADGDLIFSDDFSQSSFMWTVGAAAATQGSFELGTNASANMADVTTYMGAMASTTAANGFAFFNGVQFLLAGSVDPQNTWVMSDTIDLSSAGSISLTFQQRYRAFNSEVTYVEFSEDGGVTWAQSIVVNGAVVTNASATQNTVTVDFPVNNTQYGVVRFRWQESSDDDQFGSGYGWLVDDLKIYQGYGNNLELVRGHNYAGTQALQYTKFPVTQSDGTVEVQFDAEVVNKGYNAQDAYLNVTSGAYNQDGNIVSINPFTGDTVEILTPDGFMIPTTVGVNTLTYTAMSDNNTLQLTTDDVATMPLEVTPWIMAVDGYNGTSASIDGQFTAFSSQTAGDLTGIGTYFEIFENGEIGGVQVGIATVQTQATYIGREFYVTLLKYNGSDFEYIMQTDAKVLAAGDFGNLVNFPFDNVITVAAGEVYIAMANAYVGAGTTGGVPIAFSGTIPAGNTIGTTGETFPDDLTGLASDPATPTIVEAPVVRLDFQDHVGISEATVVTGVTTAPNPFANETTVSFNLKNDSQVSLIVTDLAGRVVYTVAGTNMTAGAQTIAIDGTAFKAGVYNYSLNIGNTVVNNRIVKK